MAKTKVTAEKNGLNQNVFDEGLLDKIVVKSNTTVVHERICCPEKEGSTKVQRQSMRKAFRDAFEALVAAGTADLNAVSFDVREGDNSVYRHYLITSKAIPEKVREMAVELIEKGKVVRGSRKAIKRLM